MGGLVSYVRPLFGKLCGHTNIPYKHEIIKVSTAVLYSSSKTSLMLKSLSFYLSVLALGLWVLYSWGLLHSYSILCLFLRKLCLTLFQESPKLTIPSAFREITFTGLSFLFLRLWSKWVCNCRKFLVVSAPNQNSNGIIETGPI